MANKTIAWNMSDEGLLQEYYNQLREAKVYASVICAVILVIGVIGHILTILVLGFFYKKGKFRYFVLFLTLTDLFSCVTAVPAEMISHLYSYPIPSLCKLKSFLWASTYYSKPACLAVIAIDRYRTICHASGWQIRQTTAIIVCIGVYIVSLLLALPVPILWTILEREVEYKNRNITVTVCNVDDRYKDQFIDSYFSGTSIVVAIVLGCSLSLFIIVQLELMAWKKKVDRLSKKKHRGVYGTEDEPDTSPSFDEPMVGNSSFDQQPYIIPDSEPDTSSSTGQPTVGTISDDQLPYIIPDSEPDTSPSTGEPTVGTISDDQQPYIIQDSEPDTSPSTAEPTVENISDDQQPYIVPDSEQNHIHVTEEESNHFNNREEEDELDRIFMAKRETWLMICLSFISCISNLLHLLSPGSESHGIVPSLNFLSHVVTPVLLCLLDHEYREGITQLKTKFVKTFCVCLKCLQK